MTHTLTSGFQSYLLTTGDVEFSIPSFCDRFWTGNILKLLFLFIFPQNPVSTISICQTSAFCLHIPSCSLHFCSY